MKTFVIVERQGNGCDYTIGCGIKVYETKAESRDALLKQLRADEDLLRDWSHADSERESVEIYEVTGAPIAVPLDAWRAEIKAQEKRSREEAKEKDERDTYAKLQKKYGASA